MNPGDLVRLTPSIWTFTVPGDPAPWGSYQRGGGRRNKQTAQWEVQSGYIALQVYQAQIQAYARQYWGNVGPRKPIEGPVRLRLEFYIAWPKSAPKSGEDAKKRWLAKNYPKRKDVRNMAKAFEDALQGICFVNDNQVIVAGPDTKAYTTDGVGYTIATVEDLAPDA